MISIVIPVFNGADWLAEAIESALEQTYKHNEIICVDDGSTDNSLLIAKKYNIKVVSQINKGLASARNTGIMNSSGQWILFLDADDKLLANCIEKLRNEIMKTTADVIAPSFKTFGTTNQEVILMPEPKLEDFRIGNRLGYCAAIRRSVLLELGGYSPKIVEGYEDLYLWINLLTRGKKIITISNILWMYRTKQVSMYTKITPKIHDKLIAQINADFPEAKLNF